MAKQQINSQKLSVKHALQSTPRYCLFFLLILTPLARGSVQGWAITTIHIITLIALTAFLIGKTLNWDWKWIKTPFDKPILSLLGLCIVSSLFSIHRQTSFWSIILLINYIVIFYLTIHIIDTKAHLLKLLYIIIGVATFLTIFGLFKRTGLNPFPWWNYPEIKSETYRLSATFGNANNLAGYMEMTLLLFLGILLSGYKSINRFTLVCFIVLFLIALTLTLSRGGWFSAFAGLLFIIFALLSSRTKLKKGPIIPVVVGLLVICLVVLSNTSTVERIGPIQEFGQATNFLGRISVWGGIIEMIKDNPLIGAGPGTFAIVYTQYQPAGIPMRYFHGHNDYLQFTAELGLPFIILMIWMIFIFYKTAFIKLSSQNAIERGIALGAMSGITAILVHSMVDFNLHIPANVILFTILAALVSAPVLDKNLNKQKYLV